MKEGVSALSSGTTTTVMPDWLNRRADSNGDKLAVSHLDGDLTYTDLRMHAGGLATVLDEFGIHAGDRVALIAKNGRSIAIAIHALIQLQAILVPVNWRLTPSEIAWQLSDAGVRHVLNDDQCASLVEHVKAAMESKPNDYNIQHVVYPGEIRVQRTHIALSDVHALVYTSGTTGFPKGTMITYGNHWWSAAASALQLGVDKDDKWLIPMPLFHVGGIAVLMRSLVNGTAAVIHDGFDETRVLDAWKNDSITLVSLVPTMLHRIIHALPNDPFQSKLRCVLLGGSSIPRSLLEACQTRGIPVASSYGLTEANSQVTTLPPEDAVKKFGSAGRPLLPTEIRVQPDGHMENGRETGEICVRGLTVTPGYWNRPDATNDAIRDGWLHTGDIGYLDDDGYLYVLDRRNDLIVSGAENIYPAELESVLLSHPDVVEAGVVGKDDPTWGQVPVAYVVWSDGARQNDDELRDYCKARLAGFKVPKAFISTEQLPRNASGKLLRRTLKSWLKH